MSNAFFQNEGIVIARALGEMWRYCAPVLALFVLWRCIRPLLWFRQEPEIWAWLVMPDGSRRPVYHWENLLGRAPGSDIVLNYPTVSRSHAVLFRYDDGSWSLADIGQKGAVCVNGKPIVAAAVRYGDKFSLGGVEFTLFPLTPAEMKKQKKGRTRPVDQSLPSVTLLLLTLFQFFTGLILWMGCKPEYATTVALCFLILLGAQWLLFSLIRLSGRSAFELETIAFFLCTLGLSVVVSDSPWALGKQMICICVGIVIYLLISLCMRDLQLAKIIRIVAAVAGVLLLLANLVIGVEINGARNWIAVGSFTFQPSELVKLCFIFVGASTMDRVVAKRNVISFIIYSAFICACLVYMNDFGAALIFFVTFLVAAFLRSGSVATIGLALVAVAFAGVIATVYFGEHVQRRFATWGHVWEDALGGGYQQTRAMIRIAVGGLFGLGPGKGWLKAVAASDTDLVFAFISEEWGFLMAVMMVLTIVVPTVFVIRSSRMGRSSFYTIAAAAATAVMTTQAILNVFGTMDLLPLTGVTFPFVSNGGSSMLCCWGLLAFVKSADVRQNAAVSVKLLKVEEENDEKAV